MNSVSKCVNLKPFKRCPHNLFTKGESVGVFLRTDLGVYVLLMKDTDYSCRRS